MNTLWLFIHLDLDQVLSRSSMMFEPGNALSGTALRTVRCAAASLAIGTFPPVTTITNVVRHCCMSPGGAK